ncbi:hypothetical protein Mal35_30860 [Gimesia maris]|nr:hypothetical protein Mal35_30860 [Gimesia maris]
MSGPFHDKKQEKNEPGCTSGTSASNRKLNDCFTGQNQLSQPGKSDPKRNSLTAHWLNIEFTCILTDLNQLHADEHIEPDCRHIEPARFRFVR